MTQRNMPAARPFFEHEEDLVEIASNQLQVIAPNVTRDAQSAGLNGSARASIEVESNPSVELSWETLPHPLQNVTPSAASSACAALRTASRAVTQFYDLVLVPTGLKATQFILLQAIQEAGEVAQCDFARENAIAVATLSRRFSGLRKKEYIQIRMGERHGERIYSLTAKGTLAVRNALPYWERAQQRLHMALGDADWHTMMDLMERIRKATRDAEQLRTENQIRPAPVLVSLQR